MMGQSKVPLKNPVFVYNTPGTYNANLTVANAGGSSSTQKPVTVSERNPAPVASFTANPLSGNAPLSVQFTDQSTNNPTTWVWDFNSDSVIDSNVKNPVFVYTSPGTYTVNLRVVNPGGSDSEIKTGYIVVSAAQPAPPAANFNRNVSSGHAPLAVQFTDNSTGGTPTSWSWDFNNDGIIDSTVQNPVFLYTSPGTYTVTLNASNAGGSDSEVKTACVVVSAALPAAPVAAFSADPLSGNAPLSVQFTDHSTGIPTSWSWDFNNDGIVDSTVQNPVFVYTSPGSYGVTLTVTNAGGSDNEVKTGYIGVSAAPAVPPVANFSGNVSSGSNPLTVRFTDISTGGTPTAWSWDFNNDGIVDSTVQNPVFVYTSPGTYTVTLTAANAGGFDSEVKPGYIVVSAAPPVPPVANFTGSPTSGELPAISPVQ